MRTIWLLSILLLVACNRNIRADDGPQAYDPLAGSVAVQDGQFADERNYVEPDYARDADSPRAALEAGMFYEPLLPYGEWILNPRYGWVWAPYDVPIGWQPYSYGHWVLTDYGWTWVSDYPWGWACFHYGRWFHDDDYGWLWIPGNVWAPSWVVWRTDGEYIGWAPMPPEARWRGEAGFDYRGLDFDVLLPPSHYCFVYDRDFLDPHIRSCIILRARNVTIIRQTNIFINITFSDRHLRNFLPIERRLEGRLGHKIPRHRLVETESLAAVVGRPGDNNEVRIFRPVALERASHRADWDRSGRDRIGTGRDAPRDSDGPALTPDELKRRHKAEQRTLQDAFRTERERMKERQKKDKDGPPEGLTSKEFKARQEAEKRDLDEGEKAGLKDLKGRQSREAADLSAGRAPITRARENTARAEEEKVGPPSPSGTPSAPVVKRFETPSVSKERVQRSQETDDPQIRTERGAAAEPAPRETVRRPQEPRTLSVPAARTVTAPEPRGQQSAQTSVEDRARADRRAEMDLMRRALQNTTTIQAPPEVKLRQDRENKALDDQARTQRSALDVLHRTELSKPPAGLTRDQIKTRQEAESRSLDDMTKRQRQVIQTWQTRDEWKQKAPAAPTVRQRFRTDDQKDNEPASKGSKGKR